MKKHFAVGQRADIFAVFAFVGDVHDGRMCRALVFFQRRRERAEVFGKMHLLHVIKRLIAEQQHAVLMPGRFNDVERRVIDIAREIDAGNFRADMLGQLVYGEAQRIVVAGGCCQHVGRAFRNCFAARSATICQVPRTFLIVAAIVVRHRDVRQLWFLLYGTATRYAEFG